MLFGAHHPKIIVPLGVKAFLDGQYISGATELDWWEQSTLSETVGIQSVPAQHFSGRGLLDRDATLWCGYVIKTSHGNLYFAGDTGYNAVTFKEIGSRCAPIKISMLPIGAYKPTWFMSPIHVSPEESVQIHLDVQSATSIGMHFGTFPLADDGEDDPVADLQMALGKYQLHKESFIVLKEGESRDFG
jgi:L-ascorbate metabolism protein UlaG (beta-lactamase superfamily)